VKCAYIIHRCRGIDVFRDTRTRYVFIIILCNKVLVRDCSVSFFVSPSQRILSFFFYDPNRTNRCSDASSFRFWEITTRTCTHICGGYPLFLFCYSPVFFFWPFSSNVRFAEYTSVKYIDVSHSTRSSRAIRAVSVYTYMVYVHAPTLSYQKITTVFNRVAGWIFAITSTVK